MGRIKEVPGVFSQDVTLTELEENIKDAYLMMMQEVDPVPSSSIHIKEIGVNV